MIQRFNTLFASRVFTFSDLRPNAGNALFQPSQLSKSGKV